MTTIATDGRSMAGDGLVTSNGTVFGSACQKVHRLPDGRLVGMTGPVYNQQIFLDWLASGGDAPKLLEGFESIVLGPDGALSYDEHCHCYPEELPTAAGSGRQIAIGAMEAGATPAQAVEIACRRNTETGGQITVLYLTSALEKAA